MIILPTLYARTSTGAIQEWTIKIDCDKYWTEYGQVDGKIIVNLPTVCLTTNEGRANERLGIAQAQFQAQALWKKKKETGYFEDIADIDNDYMIECMLAKNYDDRKDELVFPVYCQPKLDGIRCLTSINGMFSRNGKAHKGAPHIFKALQGFFEKHPDVILDGELYCDKFANDFNKICSRVKKSKPTAEDLKESAATIQYWIYDMVDTDVNFSGRSKWLHANIPDNSCLVIVETHLCADVHGLDELYEDYMNRGYEGQMVRVDAPYDQKRSKYLLKRKEFKDSEYKIISVGEGEGNKVGIAGYMLMENPNGNNFRSNIKGNREYLKELWGARNSLPGKMATVKYFHLTPDNVPRFPYIIGIRDYE